MTALSLATSRVRSRLARRGVGHQRSGADAIRTVAAALVEQSHRVVDLPAESDPFVRATGLVIAGGIAELVLVWLQGDLELTRDQLVDISAELVLAIGDSAPAIASRLAVRHG